MIRAAILCAVLLVAAARGGAADLSGLGFSPHPGAAVPLAGPFTDASGVTAPLRQWLDGRPAILQLGYYTCPNLCGVVRDDLARALVASGLRPGRDVAVAVLSIDPSERPADAARAQAALGDQARRWAFLTGAADRVARAVGFPFRPDDRRGQFLHPAGLVVLAPGGVVSGYLEGVGYDGPSLRRAVDRAAAGGVLPSPAPVLLFCFHYDPASGTWSLDVLRVLQALGVLTALTLAVLLARGHRRSGA